MGNSQSALNSHRSSMHEAVEYLISGYMRHIFLKECDYNDRYPSALDGVILEFYGGIFRFDSIHPEHEEMLEEDGTIINAVQSKWKSIFTVGSSFGVNHGIHEFKIKALYNEYDGSGIGITSNIKVIGDKGQWINKYEGYKYWWYENCGIFSQNGYNTLSQYNFSKVWRTGDIISVKVNCNDWKVEFYVNDELYGKEMKIEENMTYYFVVGVQHVSAKYQLVFP